MGYFNYHATAKRLIKDGKLKEYRFLPEYNGIKDVLLLIFDDEKHPIMPIRKPRQSEYLCLINNK
ncbi:MAG: thermostable hemolysin delta-VPH [Clostridia bacterium]|nr:thermostable hemolysin delta-VPH [Clostridia bacterium]